MIPDTQRIRHISSNGPLRRSAPPGFLPGPLATDLAAFRARNPSYDGRGGVEQLRAQEYARLDATGHVYLDWAGAGICSESQRRHHRELLGQTQLSSGGFERARARVLAHFNAQPGEYAVVFTASASSAMQLVARGFPFSPRTHLLLTADNHSAVDHLRQVARAQRSVISDVPLTGAGLRLASEPLGTVLERFGSRPARPGAAWLAHWRSAQPDAARLFAYPAQSNFSGVRHPLEWIAEGHRNGWHVLLDAAAFVPTSPLDLDRWQPDFVTLSFGKLMGHPSDLGCLIVRRNGLGQRVLDAAGPQGEDPAVEHLSPLTLAAMEFGLDHIDRIGIDTICRRVGQLTSWLLEALVELRHSNGRNLVRVYGPGTSEGRGGTVALNLLDAQGHILAPQLIERLALDHALTLPTGFFSNPGAAEGAFQLDLRAAAWVFDDQRRLDLTPMRRSALPNEGAIRVSLGLASTFADVHRLVSIIAGLRDR